MLLHTHAKTHAERDSKCSKCIYTHINMPHTPTANTPMRRRTPRRRASSSSARLYCRKSIVPSPNRTPGPAASTSPPRPCSTPARPITFFPWYGSRKIVRKIEAASAADKQGCAAGPIKGVLNGSHLQISCVRRICVYIFERIWIRVYVYIHTYTYKHTYKQTHMHAYIYIYIYRVPSAATAEALEPAPSPHPSTSDIAEGRHLHVCVCMC